MKKIMLIVEDYNESLKQQAVLKKIGFDVYSLQTATQLSHHVLTFNPDVIVAWGVSKFTSVFVGQKLKEFHHLKAKVILILQNKERPSASDISKAKVDQFFEAPVNLEKFIASIAKMLGMEPESLIEKYHKAITSVEEGLVKEGNHGPKASIENIDSALSSIVVRGLNQKDQAIKLNDKERIEKYKRFVQSIEIDTKQTSHDRKSVKKRQDELKKGWDFQLLEELDKLKRAFASALFEK